jgi:dienelactone hydrolase
MTFKARLMTGLALLLIVSAAQGAKVDTTKASSSNAYQLALDKVLALQTLTQAPKVILKDGQAFSPKAGEIQAIFYEALIYQGKPTKVYAWLGLPEGASAKNKVPAMVLVHGGGGTAWKEWVEKWNVRGFAAISIAVEGQTDDMLPKDQKKGSWRWQAHDWPGPRRPGIYNDTHKKKLEDQWMYHTVADTILAHSLIRSLPQVDADNIGLMGVSWGGVITSTVIGIDQRFAFAIPVYGCGNLSQAGNKYGKALGDNELYKNVWDPILRLDRAKLPTLWLSWPGEQHFPLDKQASSYQAVNGPHMVSLIPNMGHSQKAAMKPQDSYAFAQNMVENGKPWASQTSVSVREQDVVVVFESLKPLDSAILISSTDSGVSGSKKWRETPAQLIKQNNLWVVKAQLPKNTNAWFVNARSGALTISSSYHH